MKLISGSRSVRMVTSRPPLPGRRQRDTSTSDVVLPLVTVAGALVGSQDVLGVLGPSIGVDVTV